MEKLVSKFEELYKENLDINYTEGKVDFNGACLLAAGECKDVAIAFIFWKAEQPKRILKISDYPDEIDINEILKEEMEKDFNNFIEDYYE